MSRAFFSKLCAILFYKKNLFILNKNEGINISENNIFKNHEIVKIRLCKNDELGVYYAVAIELNLPNSSSIQILKDLQMYVRLVV